MKKNRTTPGMVTLVGDRLRIVNGDVDSLKKMRRRGRPTETRNIVKASYEPCFPGSKELREAGTRNGYYPIRTQDSKEGITKRNQDLQARFDDSCSDVVSLKSSPETEGWFSGLNRTEKSVPRSFCSCIKGPEEDQMSCLIHGLKRDDCDCGGIDGITGYRLCGGHRKTGQIVGVPVFDSERIRKSRESADEHSRKIGWL